MRERFVARTGGERPGEERARLETRSATLGARAERMGKRSAGVPWLAKASILEDEGT
jgi:hypothetical protein